MTFDLLLRRSADRSVNKTDNIPAHCGATGRPFLTWHIDQVLARKAAYDSQVQAQKATHDSQIPAQKPAYDSEGLTQKAAFNSGILAEIKVVYDSYMLCGMASPRPVVRINGLPSVSEDASPVTPISPSFAKQPQDRESLKLNMLRKIRPPPFKYAWSFYHDKHGTGDDYEGRLTLMLENIVTVKPFWEFFNRFPLENLEMKDSVHFFKRGVKPVWEDRRNVKGGCWTFRVGKSHSKEFWKEALLMAVGEQFADVIQPGDDLCGLSYSVRFNSVLVMVWNRDGTNQKSIDGIRAVVLNQLSPELKPKDSSIFYKRHSEHAGFAEAVAKAQALEDAAKMAAEKNNANVVEEQVDSDEAQVDSDEGGEALLKEAEGDKAVEAAMEKLEDGEIAQKDIKTSKVMAWNNFTKGL